MISWLEQLNYITLARELVICIGYIMTWFSGLVHLSIDSSNFSCMIFIFIFILFYFIFRSLKLCLIDLLRATSCCNVSVVDWLYFFSLNFISTILFIVVFNIRSHSYVLMQVQFVAVYAKRNKFRLTIFPRSDDHALVAALVVIFLDWR